LVALQKEANEKWNQVKELKDQKSFAKEVIDSKFKSMLFVTRKVSEKNESGPLNQIPKEVWLKSIPLLLQQIPKSKKKDKK